MYAFLYAIFWTAALVLRRTELLCIYALYFLALVSFWFAEKVTKSVFDIQYIHIIYSFYYRRAGPDLTWANEMTGLR